MHLCVLSVPRMFGRVACNCFWVKLTWNLLELLIFIFALEIHGYNSPITPQEAFKKDPKAVEKLLWKYQSIK